MEPGSRLGRYEILERIGKGGMGEVWKALDTTLRREVAIKSLPDDLASDADRLARFSREARLLAALNHPNIAAIHGLEESAGTPYLVLELVDGTTLAEQVSRGPLPVRDAIKIALQIAESLEAAHDRGIIHRDLKPDNVKVTADGRVKVLDFGLAKALEPLRVASAPAPSTMVTGIGVVVGTAAYMSPEQACGEIAGRQTDIWSFGVVLYELLSGVSPFERDTWAETIAQVIGTPPDLARLPPKTPATVRHLLRRCLEKDPRRRLQHIGDARLELEDALSIGTSHDEWAEDLRATGKPWRRSLPAWGVVAGVAAFAALAGWMVARRTTPAVVAGTMRLTLPFPENPISYPFGVQRIAITRDGSRITFASNRRLWTRRLDQNDGVALPTPVETGANPFFSPDGKWVGIFRDQGLFKISVDGGAPTLVAPTTLRHGGGTWRADNTIVFATTEGLHQVSADGGPVRLLVKPDTTKHERAYAWPHFMPDGESLLFTIVPENAAGVFRIALLDLKTLEITNILEGGSSARYLPSGHLVYAQGQGLRAVWFDSRTRRTRGDPVKIPGVEVAGFANNGASDFAVAESGTLIFLTPYAQTASFQPVWVDRRGVESPIAIAPRDFRIPRISPDGKRALFDRTVDANRDAWILDFERLSLVRLTDGPTEDILAVWSPDGQRVFFASNRTGNFDVYSQAADGATGPRLEFSAPGMQLPQAFVPGSTDLLVYEELRDMKVLHFATPDRLEPLLSATATDFRLASVSPDGRWIAYESNESGNQYEIFVRPYPRVSERREKISLDGGRYPVWGLKGSNELYYIDPAGGMMSATVRTTPELRLGSTVKLFDALVPSASRSPTPYDISPIDGRFLLLKPVKQQSVQQTNVSVFLNWFGELRALAPIR